MGDPRQAFLDGLEAELQETRKTPAPRARTRRRVGSAAAVALASAAFVAASGFAPASAAEPVANDVSATSSCFEPDPIPRDHTKYCHGIVPQMFDYQKTIAAPPYKACYVFKFYTWTCSTGAPTYVGEKIACEEW